MHTDVPGSPPWIETLPKDARGFPVPAEAPWLDGEPQTSAGNLARSILLALNAACAVCGLPLTPDSLVYRAFAQSDAATIRGWEREVATDLNGPTHMSCIFYSAFACPYLAHAKARLSPDTMFPERSRRGTRPAIMGFRDLAVVVSDAFPPTFAFLGLEDDVPYRIPSDVVDRYEAAVAQDSERLIGATGRLYWGIDSADDEVTAEAEAAIKAFPHSKIVERQFKGMPARYYLPRE